MTAVLARLRALRNQYGDAAQREQRALLRAIGALRLRKWSEVAQLHEDLLFLCALGGSAAVCRLARALLRSMSRRVGALPRAERARADDSGIAGSVTRHAYPWPLARWLARSYETEIDWRTVDDPSLLDGVVGTLLTPAERESFDSAEYGTREFIALARPEQARSDLRWLTSAPSRAAGDWDGAEAPIAWRLGDCRASVTHNVVPGIAPKERSGLRKASGDVVADIEAPLASIERLPRLRAAKVIDSARAALAARCREVNAMTYPNTDEVWWCDLGEGVALAVIGIAPEHRLTLETNTGYLLVANGVPIGYGGVTPLFRQANTGINIFDPFRGGEAAYLWTQMLRAFHTLYGSERFVINAYQFGAGNAEAIRSGAFWFYYRLGFRPALPATRTLAAREARRIAADRRYRSDARTLRGLASCDLHLDLRSYDAADYFDEALLPRTGALAARLLAREAVLHRPAAARRVARRLASELALDDFERWPREERRGFELLAPLAAGISGLRDWSAADRDALAAMLRAKGAPQERHFALKARRATRFHHALQAALAAAAP